MNRDRQTINIDGHEIPYIDQGEGEIILFLHGILSDHRIWQPHCDRLSDHYRTIAYRLSGFGAENRDTDPSHFNTTIHADELIQFCRTLHLTKIHIVAWSYSCHVALLATLNAPDLFQSITLYELFVPSYGMSDADQSRYRKDLMRMMAPSMRALRKNDLRGATDAFLQSCTNNQLTLDQLSLEAQQIKTDNLHTLPLLLSQATPKEISADMLQTIQCPIHIIWGEKTRDIFKLASKTAVSALNQSETNSMVREADHYLPEIDPNRFIQVIKSCFFTT